MPYTYIVEPDSFNTFWFFLIAQYNCAFLFLRRVSYGRKQAETSHCFLFRLSSNVIPSSIQRADRRAHLDSDSRDLLLRYQLINRRFMA
jgi:hypothetical protein